MGVGAEEGVRVWGEVWGGAGHTEPLNWVAPAEQSQTATLPWRPLLHLHLPLKGGGEVCLPSGILFLAEKKTRVFGEWLLVPAVPEHVFKRNERFTLPLMCMPTCRSSETQSGHVYKCGNRKTASVI